MWLINSLPTTCGVENDFNIVNESLCYLILIVNASYYMLRGSMCYILTFLELYHHLNVLPHNVDIFRSRKQHHDHYVGLLSSWTYLFQVYILSVNKMIILEYGWYILWCQRSKKAHAYTCLTRKTHHLTSFEVGKTTHENKIHIFL